MRKYGKIVLLLISIFTSLSFSQPENGLILWGTRELIWDDFKGKPGSSADAATLTYKLRSELKYINPDSMALLVQNFMVTNESWTKTKSDRILVHERNHFNLAEVYARKLRKAYSDKNFKFSTVTKDISIIYKAFNEEGRKKQDLYDLETEHSINRPKQLVWDKKIEEELKQLEAYSNILIPLKVDWKK